MHSRHVAEECVHALVTEAIGNSSMFFVSVQTTQFRSPLATSNDVDLEGKLTAPDEVTDA